MPAILSTAAVSFIREMLNDGNSDAQISRIVRRKWPFIPNKSIRDCINRIIDEEDETASESTDSEPAMDVEEYDSDDSSDEDYVPEEDDDDDSDNDDLDTDEEDEEDETEKNHHILLDETSGDVKFEKSDEESPHMLFNEDGATKFTSPAEKTRELRQAQLFIDHTDNRVDHINIRPNDHGHFDVTIKYDSGEKYHNFFEADTAHVIDYLNQTLSMLMIDQMPFKKVEVMVPFFPSIAVTPDAFREEHSRIIILRAFYQYMEHFAQVA